MHDDATQTEEDATSPGKREGSTEAREFIALAEAALVLARLGHVDLTHSVIAVARARHQARGCGSGHTKADTSKRPLVAVKDRPADSADWQVSDA